MFNAPSLVRSSPFIAISPVKVRSANVGELVVNTF